jgi:hypothetical protein
VHQRLISWTVAVAVIAALAGCRADNLSAGQQATVAPASSAGTVSTRATPSTSATASARPSVEPSGFTRNDAPAATTTTSARGTPRPAQRTSEPVQTVGTEQGRLYLVPGLSRTQANHAYRYIAIVTGSEPGENGHPGLTPDVQSRLQEHLPAIVARVSTDVGGKGLLAGDGTVSAFEAYTAKALGSTLYRPFFATEAGIDDSYGRNWSDNLAALVRQAGGISADVVTMMRDRAADGRAITAGQNGAAERFGGIGAQFQPAVLRNDKTFSWAPARLRGILAGKR